MSRNIWMQCGGRRNARPIRRTPWRVVEAQYINSTRKLVDSDEEQAVLERLIDGVKPSLPRGLASLHYLLFTPFRHPPLRNGSRFGARHERGIFYAAEAVETALAEVAYYRLVFLEGTRADLGLVETEHSAFQVSVSAEVGIDLTEPPFAEFEPLISSKLDYSASQMLGSRMRAEGVELALYKSARARDGGINVALFEPAFDRPQPFPHFNAWVCSSTQARVEMKEKNTLAPRRFAFPRSDYLVGDTLPSPAL